MAVGGQAVPLQGDVTAEDFPVRLGWHGAPLAGAPHKHGAVQHKALTEHGDARGAGCTHRTRATLVGFWWA